MRVFGEFISDLGIRNNSIQTMYAVHKIAHLKDAF